MRESLKQMKIQDMEQHKRELEMKMKFVDADFIRETSRRPDETYNIANLIRNPDCVQMGEVRTDNGFFMIPLITT